MASIEVSGGIVSFGGSNIAGATYHPRRMRIEPRDASGRRLARIEVDEHARPARVQVPGVTHDVYLRWDGALDDAASLRRCVLCGCSDVYVRKNFPQVTPFVIVLAFSGAAVALLGYSTNPVLYALLAVLLAVDVLSLILSERQVVCYGCGAIYTRLRIARYLRPWDRTIAERIAKSPPELPTALTVHVEVPGTTPPPTSEPSAPTPPLDASPSQNERVP